jgi:hypothetical protein
MWALIRVKSQNVKPDAPYALKTYPQSKDKAASEPWVWALLDSDLWWAVPDVGPYSSKVLKSEACCTVRIKDLSAKQG